MLETVIVGPHAALQGKADAGPNALNSLRFWSELYRIL
jgi:hypothetical protein